jgi:hypothetical protein
MRGVALGVYEGVEEVLSSVLKSVAGEIAKEEMQNYVGTAAAEIAQSAAESIVVGFGVPLLKMLFKVTDQTSKNVKILVRAPLRTGMREAQEALSLVPLTEGDRIVREERLASADFELARAESLLPSGSSGDRPRSLIGLMRGLICIERGAEGAARSSFRKGLEPLIPAVSAAEGYIEDLLQTSSKSTASTSTWASISRSVVVLEHTEDVVLGLLLRALANGDPDPLATARFIRHHPDGAFTLEINGRVSPRMWGGKLSRK